MDNNELSPFGYDHKIVLEPLKKVVSHFLSLVYSKTEIKNILSDI